MPEAKAERKGTGGLASVAIHYIEALLRSSRQLETPITSIDYEGNGNSAAMIGLNNR